MGWQRFPHSMLLVILNLLLLICPPAWATGGRDFAALYQLSQVSDLGEQVRVSLALRFFNYSGADITGATVSLQESKHPWLSHGAFQSVSVGQSSSIRLHDTFLIPKDEYERWRRGATPYVRITFKDGKGKPQQEKIQLLPGFVGRGL